jgi:hypothetical protein
MTPEDVERAIIDWTGPREDHETDQEWRDRYQAAKRAVTSVGRRGHDYFADQTAAGDSEGFHFDKDPGNYYCWLPGWSSEYPYHWLGFGRWRVWGACPVCVPRAWVEKEIVRDGKVIPWCEFSNENLVLEFSGSSWEIGVRCLQGCAPQAIGEAISRGIAAAVEKEKREADEKARAEARAACSLRALRDAPPVRWFIPGVAPAAFALKYGDKGSRKTFDAIHKALCIAAGVP